MKVIIGSDHGGFSLKEEVKKLVSSMEYELEDVGTTDESSCDYPDYALKVAEKVVEGGDSVKGILVCGTGIGMSIAANKVKGVRAALCHNEFTAQMARKHNNANVLCLGERVLDTETALKIVKTFLSTDFAGAQKDGERHKKRVDKFSEIEDKYMK